MREQIKAKDERAYWDALASYYQEITRIDSGDFHYGPQIPGEKVLRLLPKFKRGMTALELGCGAAQNSIWLAKKKVACTAMDISEHQLNWAADLCVREGVKVTLLRGELENFTKLVKGMSFDFVHSSHAMEFVTRPDTIIKRMAACLKPGGTLMVSTVHPLFNGAWVTDMVEDEDGKVYDGQFISDYFEPPDDVRDDNRCHAVSRAYPVSSWFKWFRAAGLVVTAMEEPAAVEDAPYTSDDWADHGGQLDHIPSTLIMVGLKPA